MHFLWKLSPFDTSVLGIKTAKITHLDGDFIAELKKDLKKEGVEYVTYRIAANDYSMIQSLEENGFILVDGLITLETTLDTEEAQLPLIKTATQEDEKQLIELSGSMFRGISRYYNDSVIPTKKADAIYQEWMKNSLHGEVADLVLVWKEKKDIMGFITLQKKGQIPLVGVSEKARGKGVGKGLIKAALATFKKWGLKNVIIETQVSNIQALRLYQSCGFKVVNSSLTFRWYSLSS